MKTAAFSNENVVNLKHDRALTDVVIPRTKYNNSPGKSHADMQRGLCQAPPRCASKSPGKTKQIEVTKSIRTRRGSVRKTMVSMQQPHHKTHLCCAKIKHLHPGVRTAVDAPPPSSRATRDGEEDVLFAEAATASRLFPLSAFLLFSGATPAELFRLRVEVLLLLSPPAFSVERDESFPRTKTALVLLQPLALFLPPSFSLASHIRSSKSSSSAISSTKSLLLNASGSSSSSSSLSSSSSSSWPSWACSPSLVSSSRDSSSSSSRPQSSPSSLLPSLLPTPPLPNSGSATCLWLDHRNAHVLVEICLVQNCKFTLGCKQRYIHVLP